ncbi:WD40 repeat-like protein [Neoconidiobolus thromboides FSU 785]|nr:WD40 repeat-like protein [Neoconidiobolus thromboides FSU 785]
MLHKLLVSPRKSQLIIVQISLLYILNENSIDPIIIDLSLDKEIHNNNIESIQSKEYSPSIEHLVRDIKYSKDGSKVGVILDNKQIKVYNTENWKIEYQRMVIKRPTAIDFDIFGNQVVIADKFGDAYSFNMNEEVTEDKEIEPIVGHVSVLMDILISKDNKYVLTADRDEKIRVSKYPNGYNIHGYLLGHKSYVSKMIFSQIQDKNWLFSVGGDGNIILFDFNKLIKINQLELKQYFNKEEEKDGDINLNNIKLNHFNEVEEKERFTLIGTGCENLNKIVILKLNNNIELEYFDTIEFEDNVISFTFDHQNQLIVSTNNNNNQIQCFKLNEDKTQYNKQDTKQYENLEFNKFDAPKDFRLPCISEHRKFINLTLMPEEEENGIKKKKTTDH